MDSGKKISEMRIYYRGLTLSQKKEFICNLERKLQGKKSTDHHQFLRECVAAYNEEARKHNSGKPSQAGVNKPSKPTALSKEEKIRSALMSGNAALMKKVAMEVIQVPSDRKRMEELLASMPANMQVEGLRVVLEAALDGIGINDSKPSLSPNNSLRNTTRQLRCPACGSHQLHTGKRT